MASCFKLGHFLALAGVAVLIGQMNDGFDRLEPLTLDAAQDHSAMLTNGLLMDLYSVLVKRKPLHPSVTTRLAEILHHLGFSPPQDGNISLRWYKEASKLHNHFRVQRKKRLNGVSAAEHLGAAPNYAPLQQALKETQVICLPRLELGLNRFFFVGA